MTEQTPKLADRLAAIIQQMKEQDEKHAREISDFIKKTREHLNELSSLNDY